MSTEKRARLPSRPVVGIVYGAPSTVSRTERRRRGRLRTAARREPSTDGRRHRARKPNARRGRPSPRSSSLARTRARAERRHRRGAIVGEIVGGPRRRAAATGNVPAASKTVPLGCRRLDGGAPSAVAPAPRHVRCGLRAAARAPPRGRRRHVVAGASVSRADGREPKLPPFHSQTASPTMTISSTMPPESTT